MYSWVNNPNPDSFSHKVILSLSELLMTQQMIKGMQNLNPKNQAVRKSTPVSSHGTINVNHRQISPTGTVIIILSSVKLFSLRKSNHSIF